METVRLRGSQDTDAGLFTEQDGFINTTTGDTPEQSKAIGCESPGTLSSIIIVQESAAMKTYETKKLSPLWEVNRGGY